MRIARFKIKGLFEKFNYDIDFSNYSDNIMILTGPNGYGKTTIMTCVSKLRDRDLYYFYKLPFETMSISFADDEMNKTITLDIESSYQDVSELNLFSDSDDNLYDRILKFKLSDSSTFEINRKTFESIALSMIIQLKLNVSPSDYISSIDFINAIETNFSLWDSLPKLGEFSNLLLFFLSTISVKMISTERLYPRKNLDGKEISSIQNVSNKLSSILKEAFRRYQDKVGECRDSVYDRMLENISPYSESDYQFRRAVLVSKVNNLNDWGLVPYNSLREFNAEHEKILSVYIDEVSDTIEVYDDELKKLRLLKKLLDKKMFSGKTISFNKDLGIVVYTTDGVFLNLNLLSTGEKQEIVMLYELVFESDSYDVLLIDEPENSLHVAWQNMYLDEMQEISNLFNKQMIIATHSPQIIAGHWDDCFDLYGYMEEFVNE